MSLSLHQIFSALNVNPITDVPLIIHSVVVVFWLANVCLLLSIITCVLLLKSDRKNRLLFCSLAVLVEALVFGWAMSPTLAFPSSSCHSCHQPAAIQNSESKVVRLQIASFNLRSSIIEDGPLNSWEPQRKYRAAEMLRHLNCSLIGTQEGWKDQLDFLTSQLNGAVIAASTHGRWRWFGNASDSHQSFDSAIFYDSTALKLQYGGTFWLSTTPDVPNTKVYSSALVRTCTWAKFFLIPSPSPSPSEDPVEFYLFNTHLDHVSEIARQQQARVITEQISRIVRTPALTFITGDFNALRDGVVWDQFDQENFADCWKTAQTRDPGVALFTFHSYFGKRLETLFYFAPLRLLVSLGWLLWPSDDLPLVWSPEDLHIDWIFHSRATSQSPFQSPAVLLTTVDMTEFGEDQLYASDHHPLTVDFEFIWHGNRR